MDANKKMPKNAEEYYCEDCNFICSKKSNYHKHLGTLKHQNANNANKKMPKNACDHCGVDFKHASSLSRHKKSCMNNVGTNVIKNDNNIIMNNEGNNIHQNMNALTNLIIEVVKNNNEFQKQIVDLVKNTSTNVGNYNSNNINSHNQTFNLQFFLNETCKDAINMSDFINSFNLQVSDLERLADDGYVKTLSNLIIDKVRELDVEKRPIHCSDAKREMIYIKEDDVWIKDDEEKTKLRNAINKIGCKNIGVLQDWQEAHPNYNKYNSPDNNIYLKMMKEVVGGSDTRGNENKIIKNIIKEVVIDKNNYLK
jgi:hypothetical protein